MPSNDENDVVINEFKKTKKDWDNAYIQTQSHIKSIEKHGFNKNNEVSLARLNGLAQDGLAMLSSAQFNLDLLIPQLPTDEHVQNAQLTLQSWNKEIQSLRSNLRNANLQAKANMRKAAQEERELLLGGGEESTARRRNLQTKAGMTYAAESITESLRRTRQMMVQEVERSESTLMAFEESTGVLKKAESEYKGHRSLLGRTRNLLSTMKRQDVLDRIILIVGFTLFSLAVLYVVSKRIGILKLQRKVVGAIKAGMASGKAEVAINHLAQVDEVHEVPNSLSASSSSSSHTTASRGVGGGHIGGDGGRVGGNVDFLDQMKSACEIMHPRLKVKALKVETDARDKAYAIMAQTKVHGIDLLVIGKRQSLSNAILRLLL
nr:sec20 family protein [Tanacetum cinerariifolium]